MHDLSKTISEYIEQQFPAVYREDGPNLVAFTKAYYEFMENTSESPTTLSRSMFQNRDIDETLDSFLVHFKEKYLSEFPYAKAVDKRFAIKHIMDYYRSKGTPQATELLIRLLFNEEASVYYPGDDILRASDSKYKIPKYIEVTQSARSAGFVENQITGSQTGATAFVEGLVKKRVQGRIIDILYISNIKGSFRTDELVSDDGLLANAPKIIGSLSSMNIVNGGRNNVIGDVFNVVDDTGRQGKVRVTGTEDATGRVDFELVDGGTGYTLNDLDDGDATDDYTDVRVATAMIAVDNSNTLNQFIQFETVKQEREIVTLLSAQDFADEYFDNLAANSESVADDFVLGVKVYPTAYTANSTNGPAFLRSTVSDSNDIVVITNNTIIANTEYSTNSTHIVFDSDPGDGAVISVLEYVVVANSKVVSLSADAANTSATLVITSGTFANQLLIDTADNTSLSVNEIVDEESTITLEVVDASIFSSHVGEKLEMQKFTTVANGQYLSAYAYGYLTVANTTGNSTIGEFLTLEPAFGTFLATEEIELYYANGTVQATETIDAVSVTTAGATGIASSASDANTWNIKVTSGAFTAGKKIRGRETRVEETISAITATGASDVWYNGVATANGVIDTIANNTVTGVVVGQNTTHVGLHSNTSAFSYVAGAGMTIKTSREDLKEIDLVAQPNLELTINAVGTGSGATFQPGALENEETVTLNTDFVGAKNVANVAFLDVIVGTAANSGIGFVDSITINSGVATSNGTSKYISSISQANPAVVTTTTEHGFTQGGAVTITDVKGMTEVNGNEYFVAILSTTTFALYQNSGLSTSINSTGFTAYITGGGTGYANGTGNVTFTGGGYADGNPVVSAIASITTNGSGVITSITVDNPGEGYYGTPTIVLPDNGGGTDATVVVNFDGGYGFIKNPNGDSTTQFQFLFTDDDFTMGTITSLTRINPGTDYNLDPFISVHNKYIAAFDRKNIYLNITLVTSNFTPGEIIEQDSTEKGVIISANSSVLHVKRTRFNTSWSASNIIGKSSGAIASFSVGDDAIDLVSNSMGDNAIITGDVIVADGVATTVDVIDSGYGYLGDQAMSLTSANNSFVITANSVVATEGTGTGYWETTTSHLSDVSKVRDNKYYQEYSYDIQTGVSINRYRDIVKKVLHVAGTELFGTVVKNSTINTNVTAATSTTDTVSTS
jgi:hypothetical protein